MTPGSPSGREPPPRAEPGPGRIERHLAHGCDIGREVMQHRHRPRPLPPLGRPGPAHAKGRTLTTRKVRMESSCSLMDTYSPRTKDSSPNL